MLLENPQWKATVIERGARLCSLSYKGIQILRVPESREAFEQNPFCYGSPILFPPNRIRDGKFSFQGTEYILPVNEPAYGNHIHGLVHDAPFEVIGNGENRIRLRLENEGRYYPFNFILTVTFSLDGNGLTEAFELKNTSGRPMPWALGLHTAFCRPDSFSVPIGLNQERDGRYLPTGKTRELNETEQLFTRGCPKDVFPVNGYFTSTGNTARVGQVKYTAGSAFREWVLFGVESSNPFVCIEPMTGPVDSLNTEGGYSVLEKGETTGFSVSFSV